MREKLKSVAMLVAIALCAVVVGWTSHDTRRGREQSREANEHQAPLPRAKPGMMDPHELELTIAGAMLFECRAGRPWLGGAAWFEAHPGADSDYVYKLLWEQTKAQK